MFDIQSAVDVFKLRSNKNKQWASKLSGLEEGHVWGPCLRASSVQMLSANPPVGRLIELGCGRPLWSFSFFFNCFWSYWILISEKKTQCKEPVCVWRLSRGPLEKLSNTHVLKLGTALSFCPASSCIKAGYSSVFLSCVLLQITLSVSRLLLFVHCTTIKTTACL